MADKSFGVKELNLLNASGTPTVTSPNNLNLNANTVAISTSATVGNNLTVTSTTTSANVNVTGIATVVNFNATGISTIAVPSNTNANSALLVTANGSSAYRFTGPGQDGSDDNPNIYLVRGQRYIFTNNSGGSHPFQIRVANGGAAYSTGVTNNGASSGNIIFNVQHDAPAQLYYQCTNHGGMVGNIYVVGGPQVISGVITATSFSGSGANLTSLPAQATIANNADNRVITGGSGVNLNGESNLTWDGFDLDIIRGNTSMRLTCTNSAPTLNFNANNVADAGRITLSESSGGGVMRFFTKNTGGSFAEKVRIQTEGGISFNGDTAAANALDDYEEGNYDVSVTGSGGGSIGTQGNINNLRYTKIGRLIHVTGRIYLNTSNNPSGDARMSLPFTAAANTNDQNGQGYSYVTRYNVYNPNSDYNLVFEIEPNVAFGVFLWDRPGAGWTGVNAGSELNQNACYLGFDFTYTTAS